jgi:putative membrane protein
MSKSLIGLTAGACMALGLAYTARGASAARVALTDAEVLGIYIQVNGFDVEASLLARAQASSKEVRALATHVSTDHIGVRQAAHDLATKCKVTPVLPIARDAAAIEHSRAMTKLAALSGAAFDQAYLEHDVAFHRAAVEAVRQVLLPATSCEALKAHLNDVLPAFEHHLTETEALARELTAR